MVAHLLILNIVKTEVILVEKVGSLEILDPNLVSGIGLDLTNKFSVC